MLHIQTAKEARVSGDGVQSCAYVPLGYANHGIARHLDFTSTIQRYGHILKQRPTLNSTETFLRSLTVVPSSEDCRGITWLELYIWYRQNGFCQPIATDPKCAKRMPTLDKQVRAFKKLVRYVVPRALICSPDIELFKPSGDHSANLIGVGLTGKHPALSFNIAIDEDQQRGIARHLIRLGRTLPAAKAEAFLDCTCRLIPRALVLKGKAKWDAAISRMPHQRSVKITEKGLHPPPIPALLAEDAFLLCTLCKIAANSLVLGIQSYNLDAKTRCRGCGQISRIKDWSCTCGTEWHLCLVHYHLHDTQAKACPMRRPPPARISLKSMRNRKLSLRDNGTYENILAEDKKYYGERKKRFAEAQVPCLILGRQPASEEKA